MIKRCYLSRLMGERKIKDISHITKKTGLTYRTIIKLYNEENLETVKLGTLYLVCDALECDLYELVEYRPEKKI